MRVLGAAFALCFGASAALSATHTQLLNDYPSPALGSQCDFGLRICGSGLFFAFRVGSVTPSYDDVALTATTTGMFHQSTPVGQTLSTDISINSPTTGPVDAGGMAFKAAGGPELTEAIGRGAERRHGHERFPVQGIAHLRHSSPRVDVCGGMGSDFWYCSTGIDTSA